MVSPFAVALAVLRNAETRSLVKSVLNLAGHRLIESGGYLQASLLLDNGFDPDLLLIDSSLINPSEAAQLSLLLKRAPGAKTCVILGIGESWLRAQVAECGIEHILTRPTTRRDLELVVERLGRSDEQTVHCDTGVPAAQSCVPSGPCPGRMPNILHLEELGDNGFFLAASPKMLEIHRQAKLLAASDVNVLVLGESGTGKEIIARLIHKHSRRARNKMHKVNCAALPEDLLESELFGCRQGAFTGAIRDRMGKFEQADQGTLLLDEIGEISGHMQSKFLQVLQDGQFCRLGGEQAIRVDVRVIATTNIQMESALRSKAFREDLYYRLSVFTIQIPPLRERRDEIPFLMEEMIRRMPADMRIGVTHRLPPRLIDSALLYEWRGNVRELYNFVTRTVVMRDWDSAVAELEAKIAEAATAKATPSPVSEPAASTDLRALIRDSNSRTEVTMIKRALDASGWNRRRAAQNLNISYRGLLYKIQKHQLTPGRHTPVTARDITS